MEKETPSFAFLVKEEIASFPRDDENKRSLLSSFIKINGHLKVSGGKDILELSSSSSAIAKLIYQYIHDLYGVNVRFAYTRSPGFLKRMVYHVIVDEEADDILSDLGISFFDNKPLLGSHYIETQAASYLAGAFLASGSVNDPRSTSYHLEIAFLDEEYAKFFLKVFTKVASHAFTPRLAKRRKEIIVYLKKSEEISDFLILVGAKGCCLKFEDVRIARDYTNVTNRLANLDTANLGRTLSSSERQVKEITYFKSHGGFGAFSNPKVEILADIRLEHPDASLSELSVLLSESISSTVTRSNINHLFREMDEEYRRNEHHGK